VNVAVSAGGSGSSGGREPGWGERLVAAVGKVLGSEKCDKLVGKLAGQACDCRVQVGRFYRFLFVFSGVYGFRRRDAGRLAVSIRPYAHLRPWL
jgi:hypothetical protein